MMNDGSVSECDICVTKENRGVDLYTSHDFHKKFNTFLNITACLNPIVSMHLSMATTHSSNLTKVH